MRCMFFAISLSIAAGTAGADTFQAQAQALADGFRQAILRSDTIPYLMEHTDPRLEVGLFILSDRKDVEEYRAAVLSGYEIAKRAFKPLSAQIKTNLVHWGKTSLREFAVFPFLTRRVRVGSQEIIERCLGLAIIEEAGQVFVFTINEDNLKVGRELYPDMPDLADLPLDCGMVLG